MTGKIKCAGLIPIDPISIRTPEQKELNTSKPVKKTLFCQRIGIVKSGLLTSVVIQII